MLCSVVSQNVTSRGCFVAASGPGSMSQPWTLEGLVSAMNEQKKVWYLRRLDLFLSLTDEEVEAIARLLDDHEIPAGAELLRDRKRDRIYLIKQGAVRLYIGDQRRQVTVALLGSGRLFGLSTTFDEDAPAMRSGHPEAILYLFRDLAQAPASRRADLPCGNVAERLRARNPRVDLAGPLIELCDQFCDSAEGGNRSRFRMTQADLARMLNVSRETVSRLMAKFNEAGWVSPEGVCWLFATGLH